MWYNMIQLWNEWEITSWYGMNTMIYCIKWKKHHCGEWFTICVIRNGLNVSVGRMSYILVCLCIKYFHKDSKEMVNGHLWGWDWSARDAVQRGVLIVYSSVPFAFVLNECILYWHVIKANKYFRRKDSKFTTVKLWFCFSELFSLSQVSYFVNSWHSCKSSLEGHSQSFSFLFFFNCSFSIYGSQQQDGEG